MFTNKPKPPDIHVTPPYVGFELGWLHGDDDWSFKLKDVEAEKAGDTWSALVALANTRMDFVRTIRLDRALSKLFNAHEPPRVSTKAVRLAVLASSTVSHLLPAIRAGCTPPEYMATNLRNILRSVFTGTIGYRIRLICVPAQHHFFCVRYATYYPRAIAGYRCRQGGDFLGDSHIADATGLAPCT